MGIRDKMDRVWAKDDRRSWRKKGYVKIGGRRTEDPSGDKRFAEKGVNGGIARE